jgi:DNA modification methylase
MAETFLDGRVTMLLGDVRAMLKMLPADHFDCIPTSPPYWRQRDYGCEGQIGMEATLGEHIETMVSVFEEIKRVLKPTGSVWLNYGDCYATTPNGRSVEETKIAGNDDRTFRNKPASTIGPVYGAAIGQPFVAANGTKRRGGGNAPAGGYLKPGDLCMVPNRLAIALQARDTGELSTCPDLTERCALRGDKDRDGHRWIRMPFYYSAEDVKQPAIYADSGRSSATKNDLDPDRKRNGKDGNAASFRAITENRLLRQYEPAPLNVWDIATEAFSEAHFATMPQALVERCLRAGCPTGGKVLDPFGGAGTVGLVAAKLGHTATLIDLNPEYATMARARIEAAFMGKEEGARHMVKKLGRLALDAGPLFATNP